MRTVYANAMVAHLWANQSQENARNGNGSFYFEGKTIYSYGSHFPIARIVKNKRGETAVLYNPGRYSMTTACHQSRVRQAVSHLRIFTVPQLGERWAGKLSHVDNLAYLSKAIKEAVAKVKTARKSKSWAIGEAEKFVQEANAYATFFGLRKRFTLPNLAEERAKAEEYDRKEAERHLERDRKRELLRQAEREAAVADLERWKAGEKVRISPYFFDEVFLRVNGDIVETSKGAEVPLAHAIRILPHVRSGRSYQHNGHSIHIGQFRIDAIDQEGNLRAGCHFIKRNEIERLADQLGL